jgi:hypothetical protein
MNKPLTVNELLQLCKMEISKGNGDKSIMISQDDEGNGYHYLWFGFTTSEEMQEDDMFTMCVEEDVAPMSDTIILG